MNMITDAEQKAIKLFHCALAVLNDWCPFEEQHQLCRRNEDYLEGICDLCWSNYLFKVINGEENKEK